MKQPVLFQLMSFSKVSIVFQVVEKLSKRIELLSEEVKNHKMKIISLKEKRDESFAPQISSGGPIQKIHRNLASVFAITVLTAHIYLVM